MGYPTGTTPRPKRTLGIQGPNAPGKSMISFKRGSTKGTKRKLWMSGRNS